MPSNMFSKLAFDRKKVPLNELPNWPLDTMLKLIVLSESFNWLGIVSLVLLMTRDDLCVEELFNSLESFDKLRFGSKI